MAYQAILDSEVQVGAVVDAVLTQKIKNNEADANARIVTLESSVSAQGARLTSAESAITTHGTQISTIQSQLSSVDLISEVIVTAGLTLDLTQRNKLITYNSTSAGVFTVPLNSAVAFPIGSQISFSQLGTGQLSIAAASGVTITTEVGLKLNAQNAMASIIKTATDTWRLTGSLKV